MKLESYTITAETLRVVIHALSEHWFEVDESGSEHNNDEVIVAQRTLEAEIAKQENGI